MENLSNLVIYRYTHTGNTRHALLLLFWFVFGFGVFFGGGWLKDLYAQRATCISYVREIL